jgi:hypothetical protein
MKSNLSWRNLDLEVSTDTLAEAVLEICRRLAPGKIHPDEEIAIVGFKKYLEPGQYWAEATLNLEVTLRKHKVKMGDITSKKYG